MSVKKIKGLFSPMKEEAPEEDGPKAGEYCPRTTVKQSAKETSGFLLKHGAKGSLGMIPIAGPLVQSFVDGANEKIANRKARQELMEELKYSILLVNSC